MGRFLKNHMRLKDKVAIITGGSRGIGLETAKLFSREGAKVVITSKDPNRLQKASEMINGVTIFPADVRKEKQVKNVVSKTMKKFGKIDVLVNNAGIFPKIKLLHEIKESEWNEVIDVNLGGPFRFTKEVLPFMKKHGGSIINISSDAGLKAFEGFHADAYSASKAALNLLTKTWSLEYAKDKIRVNCICPGVVDTDMTKPFLRTNKDREFMNKEHPIGRIGMPQDVAQAVLFFASDDSSWTTGAILPVDGGESTK